MVWFKSAGSIGSAPSDPVKDQTALAPIPMPALENKPAPGQTGPKGMSPRTTYSKVNTGSPPVMDAGAVGQKSSPNLGMDSLPAKIAEQRGSMTTMHERPSLQAMVKAAMAGSSSALQVTLEATRQSSTQSGSTKTASAKAVNSNSVSTEMVQKLASAIGHIEQLILKEAEGPGEGPGALEVTEATSSETNLMDAGQSGQATSKNQPPMNPPLQADKVQEGNAGTGLETNDEMSHPEQPVEPIKNAAAQILERLSKTAKDEDPKGHHLRRSLLGNATSAAIEAEKGKKLKAFGEAAGNSAKNSAGGLGLGAAAGGALGAGLGALKGGKDGARRGAAAGALAGAGLGAMAGKLRGEHGAKASEIHGKYSKHAGAPIELIRKLAEDAINPAQISASKGPDATTPPEGVSASGEGVPSEPSDVTSQKAMIASNEAAINYTKGQAKADPKKDVNQVLTEPALSAATDKVLAEAFDNTGAAGVKISAANPLRKTAAQVGAQRMILQDLIKRASADVNGR